MSELKPRLLLTEDDAVLRNSLCRLFSSPPPLLARNFGIPAFDVYTAGTGAEAEKELQKAALERRPFDVLALDIGLPEAGPGDAEDPAVGWHLLESLVRPSACAAVVIHSCHAKPEEIVRSMRDGVIDFVPKPHGTEKLLGAVFRAVGRGRERAQEAWQKFRREHFSAQLGGWAHAESHARVADRIGRAVHESVIAILDCTNDMHDLVGAQGDSKASTALQKAIWNIRQAASETLNRCVQVRGGASLRAVPRLVRVTVEELVREVIDSLEMGIAYKRLALRVEANSNHVLLAFKEDLAAILDAMLFCWIDAAPEEAPLWVRVTEPALRSVAVSVTAPRRSALADDSPADAEGETPLPGQESEWSLALARRLAHNACASIRAETSPEGHTVTLQLPVIGDEEIANH